MIRLPETGPEVGRCVCGVVIREDSFRDKKSEKEWFLSSLCMECQDRVFLVPPQEVGAVRHTVRFGVLAAHRRSGRQILEVALLPFRFIPALHIVAWEPRYTLRIGPVLPLTLPAELDPMFRILAGHRVHLTEVDSFEDPRLAEWFSDLDLLATLDRRAGEEIVGACPVLGDAHAVALADAIPWRDIVSRPLIPFDGFVRSRGLDLFRAGSSLPPSPLRLCARLGAALGLEEHKPLWHLFESVKDQFSKPLQPEGVPR